MDPFGTHLFESFCLVDGTIVIDGDSVVVAFCQANDLAF